MLDVSGDLISTKELIQNFQKANPKLVSDVKFLTADSPSLVGKVKAQQNSGHVDIDLVLTGNDGIAAGLKQDMWVKLFPNLAPALPNLDSTLTPVAKKMQPLGSGYGLINRAGQNGPLLQYDPKQVPNPPQTPQALLDWAKAHPNKFSYARPSNSGPGRTFLMALPYLLHDKNPARPGQRLGQDLGLPEAARPVRPVLSVRHLRHGQDARPGPARDHPVDHRLRHAGPLGRHAAQGLADRRVLRPEVGRGRALHGDPARRRPRPPGGRRSR